MWKNLFFFIFRYNYKMENMEWLLKFWNNSNRGGDRILELEIIILLVDRL